MKRNETIKVQRRAFLTSTPLLILGAGSLNAFPFASQNAPKGPELSERLSPAEMEIVNESIMSGDLENVWSKGIAVLKPD